MGSGICHKEKAIQLRLEEGRNSAEEVQRRLQDLPSCDPWVGFKSINLQTLHMDLQRMHNFTRFFRATHYPKKVKNLQCASTGHDKGREEKGPWRGKDTELDKESESGRGAEGVCAEWWGINPRTGGSRRGRLWHRKIWG